MQALSVWPSKNDFRVVPKLGTEVAQVGSYCISRTIRRRGRWVPNDYDSLSSRSGLILVAGNLRGITTGACLGSDPEHDVDYRKFSIYPKFKGCFFFDSKPFRASVALSWTVEGQSVANEFVEEDSDSLNGLSSENLYFGNVDEGKDNNQSVFDGKKHKNEDPEEQEEEEEEKGVGNEEVMKGKSGRVDVRALAAGLKLARTVKDVEEVLQDKVELPLQVYSSMIRGFGKDKRLDSAMILVQWLKERKGNTNGSTGPNLFIYNSLLGAVKQSEQFEEAEKVMNDMATDGVVPNVVTYNTLMGIYIQQGREVEALNLFREIENKGLSPSPASYSTALLAYRRLEDGFGALKFYVELKEKYQKGSIGKDAGEDWETEFAKLENFTVRICYQVMRRWLVKRENLSSRILKLLTDMDGVGLQTGRAEYEKLVWACTREDHYIVGKELYNRIREKDSDISVSVCNHVIWLMGKAKKWWAALEIYEDLLDKGPKPNNMSYELVVSHFNILLTAARRRGIWRWGVRLLNKMEEKGLKPGTREWNAVLVACSKASETSAAVEIFRRMVERGEKPTIISYGALLSALEKGKLYDEAHLVWDHMIKVGVEPNLYAYTIMASIYTAQGKFNIVESIIRDMVATGIEPTVVTFNAIISGCAQTNMGSAAYEWFHKMKAQSISPNNVTYEMLIEALTRDGKPKLAFDMYLRAQNEGLSLCSKAYDAVVQSSQAYGATIDVSALGPKPPERKQKVLIRKNLSEFSNLADVPRRSKPFDRKEISYTPQTEEAWMD